MHFKIDWASHIVGSKFIVFALLYFVFEGNFPSTSPRGAYILRGYLTEVFLRYRFGGLIHGGAYFRNFTVSHAVFTVALRETETTASQGNVIRKFVFLLPEKDSNIGGRRWYRCKY